MNSKRLRGWRRGKKLDAVVEHHNVECIANGVHLLGFVVDDGARHWVWARDAEDAKDVVLECHSMESFESDLGVSREAVSVWGLTVETLDGVMCQCEDEPAVPMLDAMMECQQRVVVACSEF